MQSPVAARSAQTCLTTWWQDAGTVSLLLPISCRENWLEAVSQVIRCFRLLRNAQDPSERRFYRSLCLVGLDRMRADGLTLLAAGYLPPARLCRLMRWERSLADALAA